MCLGASITTLTVCDWESSPADTSTSSMISVARSSVMVNLAGSGPCLTSTNLNPSDMLTTTNLVSPT